jgi:hypothetical protein
MSGCAPSRPPFPHRSHAGSTWRTGTTSSPPPPDLSRRSRLVGTGRPAKALLEGGWTVDNGVEPHRATFYLTKQQTARPIGQTLTRG